MRKQRKNLFGKITKGLVNKSFNDSGNSPAD